MTFKLGDIITVKAKTKHAKNRMQFFGDRWIVTAIREERLATISHKSCKGPFLLLCDELSNDDLRWVSAAGDDPHFEIVKSNLSQNKC